jgi:hypothetical protein
MHHRLRAHGLVTLFLLLALLASTLPHTFAHAAQYPLPDETIPPPKTEWSYTCANQVVTIAGEGMIDANPQTLRVPSDALWSTIQLGGVAFNKNVPDSTLFEFASGDDILLDEPSRLVNSDTVAGVSPLMNAYTFETGGIPGLVRATADDPDDTTQALVQYTATPTDTAYTTVGETTLQFAWGGHDGNGAIGPAVLNLELPAALEEPTTIQVQVAVMDKEPQTERDKRIAIIRAEAGSVVTETVLLNPDPETDQLNLRTLTLPDVPAGTSSVTVQLISPEVPKGESSLSNPEAGDSVFLLGASAAHACEPGPVEPPDVEPSLACVIPQADNTYTAYFGYRNNTDERITIPIGTNNRFDPAPINRGQPTIFQPGSSTLWPDSTFPVNFNGSDLTWHLDGASVTASADSPRCIGRVFFEKEWQDSEGNPAAVLADDLDNLLIIAESSLGSATCAYTATSDNLVCSYASVGGISTNGLLVPLGESYTVTESNVPEQWDTTAGTGDFSLRISGNYCERDTAAEEFACTHPVVNTQQELPWATDWNGEFYLGGDAAVCLTNPQWVDLGGYVELAPAESQGTLQTVWQITSPTNADCPASAPNCTDPQVRTRNIESESQFRINAWWPGIRQGDTSIMVDYRVNVLGENGTPLGDDVKVSLFWLPWVCNPFPVISGVAAQSERVELGSSQQGVQMTLPGETLTQRANLSLTSLQAGSNPSGVEEGEEPIVKTYQLSISNPSTNRAATLKGGPTISISYTQADLDALGLDESSESQLQIRYYTPTGWTNAATSVDTKENTASATLTDISSLGLVRLVGPSASASNSLYLPLVQH